MAQVQPCPASLRLSLAKPGGAAVAPCGHAPARAVGTWKQNGLKGRHHGASVLHAVLTWCPSQNQVPCYHKAHPICKAHTSDITTVHTVQPWCSNMHAAFGCGYRGAVSEHPSTLHFFTNLPLLSTHYHISMAKPRTQCCDHKSGGEDVVCRVAKTCKHPGWAGQSLNVLFGDMPSNPGNTELARTAPCMKGRARMNG